MGLQSTHNIGPPRADLEKNDFETLIFQKGRRVLYEKALQCPCKSQATNQQSNCKNCGGSGWTYINPKSTRMVITGLSVATSLEPWSDTRRGMIKVTCSDTEQLTFMDRLSLIDGNSIHQEVLFFKKEGSEYFAYSSYPIKSLMYAGLFVSTELPFARLSSELTFTDGNLVKLDASIPNPPDGEDEEHPIAVTVRYYHAPVYYVLELPRETMQSFKVVQGQELNQNLPISALARRSHYVLNAPLLVGTRLVDNSFEEGCCDLVNEEDCLLPQNPAGNYGINYTNFIIGETPTGLVNGSNPTYHSINLFRISSLEVFRNGIRQKIIDDYNTVGTNTINFVRSPLVGEKILLNYIKL